MERLVTTEWLQGELGADDLAILDVSAHLPAAGRDPAAEFLAAHIPNAQFFDLRKLMDLSVSDSFPAQDRFIEMVREAGISRTDRIVVYDDSDLHSSARASFLFKLFLTDNIAILSGGLASWRAQGLPLETGPATVSTSGCAAPPANLAKLRSKPEMLENIQTGREQVIDARDAARFTGEVGDAVHGLPGGHIPGARNLHFASLLNDDRTFKDAATLHQLFGDAGIDLDQPIVATCGSGMTASVVLFALDLIGYQQTALYDGSWSDWGADPNTPKETGPAR